MPNAKRSDEAALRKFIDQSVKGVFKKHIRDDNLKRLRTAGTDPDVLASIITSSLGMREHSFEFGTRAVDFSQAFHIAGPSIRAHVLHDLDEFKTVKLRTTVHAVYSKTEVREGHAEKIEQNLWLKPGHDEDIKVASATGLDTALSKLPGIFVESSANARLNGSGFVLERITEVRATTIQLPVFKVGSYIPTPQEFKHSRASIVNFNFDDDQCFKRSVVAGISFDRVHGGILSGAQISRWNQYKKYEDELTFAGITYPTPMDYLDTFEEANNVSVTVIQYDCDERELFFPRQTKFKSETHINLLLLESGDKQHFTYVHDLAAFLTKFLTKNEHKQEVCQHCGYHTAAGRLHKHVCTETTGGPLEMLPVDENKELSFGKNRRNMWRKGYVMYADFESTLVPMNDRTEHRPNSFALYALNNKDGFTYDEYVGEDAADRFMDTVKQTALNLYNIKARNEPMVLTPEQEEAHEKATECYMCHEGFGETKGRRKAADHNHETGEYRGAAHSTCNLHRNDAHFNVDVYMHNFKGYDSHFLMSKGDPAKFNSEEVDGTFSCIPDTIEKYKAVFWKPEYPVREGRKRAPHIRISFKDSQPFFSPTDSLESLIDKRKKDNLPFPHFDAALEGRGLLQHRELLLQKGVYPYSFVEDISRLDVTDLPTQQQFHDKLRNKAISKSDYQHAGRVWSALGCKTFRDYHLFYLMSDTLLLADVFEGFRDMFHKAFELDPAHYVGLPAAVWDACMKMTGVTLELITDHEMFDFVESAKRGGISMISNRYGAANNKYMGDGHDPTKESSYIQYQDANSLYPTVMRGPLPVGKFAWGHKSVAEILEWTPDCDWGAFVELDTEYPTELHDLHNDYPIQEEKMSPSDEQVGPKTRRQRVEGNIKDVVPKLVPNLYAKKGIVCHIERAKFWIQQGIKVTNVGRALLFEQKPFMLKYVEFCATMRRRATTAAERDFWKLCMNQIFGKTIEDVRKRCNFHLVTDYKKMRKLSIRGLQGVRIFGSTMAGVMIQREKVYMNKPIAIGVAILDLSKVHMGRFYYDYLKPKYGDKIKLLATDTDSFIYHVKTDDIYDDMAQNPEWFDFSAYDKAPWHRFHSRKDNANVQGKFKDEGKGLIIVEFVGTKPKVYSYEMYDPSKPDKKTGKLVHKGVSKYATEIGTGKALTHENIKDVLFNNASLKVERMHFVSKNHRVSTIREEKKATDDYDSKRWIEEGETDTRALGHFKNIV